MNTLIAFLLVILILAVWYILFVLKRKWDDRSSSERIARLAESKIRLESDLARKSEELGELRSEIKKISKERDELAGRFEALSLERAELQSARKYLEKELSETKDTLTRHEAEETRKQKEFEARINHLSSAEKALEDERQRIRREDEAKQLQILEEQARIWNDHEQMVISSLRDICQKSHMNFTLHDNTNLPAIFTKLKPDAIIPFLGQYIVFDAKKSKSVKTYIPDQVKSTAKKYKGIAEIYPTIFFVVPSNEMEELKTLSFFEEGFSFYVISRESLEPILSSLKKISEYDTIADFDPQDRETIVNLIANYDRHISLQNAANILFTRESIGLMNSKDGLHTEIQKEIASKKENMRTKKLNEWELKKIAQSMGEQEQQVNELLLPKVAIWKDEQREAEKLLD